jgi:hypothetical protein
MLTHFPERRIARDKNVASEDTFKTMYGGSDEAWKRSRDLFKGKKMKWAINKFKSYMSPRPDRILPTLFQKGIKALLPSIVLLCRASYTLGYLSKAWRGVKMVYIPKAGSRILKAYIIYTYQNNIFTVENHGEVDRSAYKLEVPSKATSA